MERRVGCSAARGLARGPRLGPLLAANDVPARNASDVTAEVARCDRGANLGRRPEPQRRRPRRGRRRERPCPGRDERRGESRYGNGPDRHFQNSSTHLSLSPSNPTESRRRMPAARESLAPLLPRAPRVAGWPASARTFGPRAFSAPIRGLRAGAPQARSHPARSR